MTEQRFMKAQRAAWIGVVGNLALALMKGIVGYISNSKALMADAAHSASDVAGSLAVLVGLRAAQMQPDKEHPYGHGKAEPIAAIVVSVILLFVGIEIFISSVKSLYFGVSAPPGGIAIIAIIASIVVKEALFQYKYRLGKKLSSQALVANAWEHRSDVYSSVAALIGVGGAVLGGIFGVPWLYYLDPIAGVVVSAQILKMGYDLVKETVHNTLDHVLQIDDTQELYQTIQTMHGVIAVDELRAREHGHYVIIDLKISVNPRITVSEGHDIAKAVKHRLLTRFSHVSDVFVHVNPYDPGYPYKNNVDPDHDDFPTLLH
ncbi:cation diffusion facilitator family transporter [Ferviditalea candida]|uniref:Cation diffusion facilitator family transporter n=1 Tax=Ferviditalea candida TaxID=3108399 RepID=A0ABU5ZJG5_9BACL|nr:cation diffusion facilitator family transporter [Paenibacillaceae bacterium T2]